MQPSTDVMIYTTEDGSLKLDVLLREDTIWLSQQQIVDLFQGSQANVAEHIAHIYEEGELDPESTMAMIPVVRREGNRTVRRTIQHYNLDMIISVGYRVQSKIATRFRQWATQRLVEYVVKGFTMDDERLKNPQAYGQQYFDELLQRIRDIRASELRAYQKIRDVYKLAVDYDPSDAATREFYAKMQNIMHYAITGMTAAEIVKSRANREKANMGLTNWQGSRIRKGDVAIAKNYLDEQELDGLNRIVTMFLDFAENRARQRRLMHMADWEERLSAFLEFNEMEILEGSGSVSAEIAKAFAHEEYEAFDGVRRYEEAVAADVTDIEEVRKTIDGNEYRH
ncbi:MAG: virulence RhuM family protein [Thermomicrobiales bacterium]|nr:virulence RhuM family protein [Thermomicrobiales bacterium]MCO5224264.1 virulence RhuM family protein [Thermomicrobiales bacterium]MCO5227143.1 virulence RhuM family protein [Thermomicrobiales bacterium]